MQPQITAGYREKLWLAGKFPIFCNLGGYRMGENHPCLNGRDGPSMADAIAGTAWQDAEAEE